MLYPASREEVDATQFNAALWADQMVIKPSASVRVIWAASPATASPCSTVIVAAPMRASPRILKRNVAMRPFSTGLSPPARLQTYEYDLVVVQVRDLPDSFAAPPGLGPSPSTCRS